MSDGGNSVSGSSRLPIIWPARLGGRRLEDSNGFLFSSTRRCHYLVESGNVNLPEFWVRVKTVQFLGHHNSSVSQRGEVKLEKTFG